MSTTPRTDAAANPTYCECDPGTVVNIKDARQLETELAALQKRYADDVAELNARLIQRREDHAAHSVKQAQELQTLRMKLEQSESREMQYRNAIENNSGWEIRWDKNGNELPMVRPAWARDALSQPAPPVVPIADVKPLLDVLNEALLCTAKIESAEDDPLGFIDVIESDAKEIVAAFNLKHPEI